MMLGELINWLEKVEGSTIATIGFHNPHSYRRYYQDLAFEPQLFISFREMLAEAIGARDSVFTGYKGGEYRMHKHVDVHLAEYGQTGEGIGPILLTLMEESGKRCEECLKKTD